MRPPLAPGLTWLEVEVRRAKVAYTQKQFFAARTNLTVSSVLKPNTFVEICVHWFPVLSAI